MTLQSLLTQLKPTALHGEAAGVVVSGVSFDSRRVEAGHLFVAVRGTQVDGHDYIDQAIERGAVAVVREGKGTHPGAVVAVVEDTSRALAQLAARWHDHPSRELTLIGITGTNGKTTVATLLHELFTGLGYRAGLLSTVEVRIGGEARPANHTTPDALAIHAALAEMRTAGVDYVFMEVSSHAVAQRRTYGLDFNGGVFTNLSHDHLDYHGTFADYLKAKKTFFDELPKTAFALSNLDDKRGAVMLQNTRARMLTYSLRRMADYRARLIDNTPAGLQLEIDGTEVFARLLGRFNAYNLLAAYGVARELGQDKEETLVQLSQLGGAAGRMEPVADPSGRLTALVDYAHTPDALENVLTTLRSVLPTGKQLLCVVGAGGDRDKAKRPEMARIGARLADRLFLTSDNPRSEDPEAILDDMETGLTGEARHKTLRIADRRSAIRTAVMMARPGDLLLVAGKGHETYQEIKGQRLPFDDKLELTDALNSASHAN